MIGTGSVTIGDRVQMTGNLTAFLGLVRAAVDPSIPLHVTSGVNTPEKQVENILTNVYFPGGAAAMKKLYGETVASRLTAAPATVEGWLPVFQKLKEERLLPAGHPEAMAFDLRILDLDNDQVEKIADGVRRAGGIPKIETTPRAMHVRLPKTMTPTSTKTATSSVRTPPQAAPLVRQGSWKANDKNLRLVDDRGTTYQPGSVNPGHYKLTYGGKMVLPDVWIEEGLTQEARVEGGKVRWGAVAAFGSAAFGSAGKGGPLVKASEIGHKGTKDTKVRAPAKTTRFGGTGLAYPIVDKIDAGFWKRHPGAVKNKANARIIEEEAESAGIPPELAAAMLANAWNESAWDADITGDVSIGGSVGLFQIYYTNEPSVEWRQDPHNNTQWIIAEMLRKRGRTKNPYPSSASRPDYAVEDPMGAWERGVRDIGHLTAMFMLFVEHPKYVKDVPKSGGDMQRRQTARELFPGFSKVAQVPDPGSPLPSPEAAPGETLEAPSDWGLGDYLPSWKDWFPNWDSKSEGYGAIDSYPLTGTSFATEANKLVTDKERQALTVEKILAGQIPKDSLRFVPIAYTATDANGKTHDVVFYAAPDYLAIGTDKDKLTAVLGLPNALLVAGKLGFSLPTPMMVDKIWAAASHQYTPQPLPATADGTMRKPGYQVKHRGLIDAEYKAPHGILVAGHKKDVVLTEKLVTQPTQVAIYGWHRTSGKPIQGLYLGHGSDYADYSHGIRPIASTMKIDGRSVTYPDVLADPLLHTLVNREAAFTPGKIRGVVTTKPAIAPAPGPAPESDSVADSHESWMPIFEDWFPNWEE